MPLPYQAQTYRINRGINQGLSGAALQQNLQDEINRQQQENQPYQWQSSGLVRGQVLHQGTGPAAATGEAQIQQALHPSLYTSTFGLGGGDPYNAPTSAAGVMNAPTWQGGPTPSAMMAAPPGAPDAMSQAGLNPALPMTTGGVLPNTGVPTAGASATPLPGVSAQSNAKDFPNTLNQVGPNLTPPSPLPSTGLGTNPLVMPTNAQTGPGGSPGGLTPNPATNYDPRYGGIPVVPDPINTQGTALQGDLSNMGYISGITNQLDALTTNALRDQYSSGLPGYNSMLQQSSANIGNELAGNVPPDVLALLRQQGAERGIGTGTGGSGNANAAYLRALGLTSTQLQQQGESNLTNAIARTPIGAQFNPAGLLVTPEQQQAAQSAANLYASAPQPLAAHNAALAAAQAGLTAGGGAGGGGGGGGLSGLPGTGRPAAASTPPWEVPGQTYGATPGGTTPYGPAPAQASHPAQNWQSWASPAAGNNSYFGTQPQDQFLDQNAAFDDAYYNQPQGNQPGSPGAGIDQWFADQFPDLFGFSDTSGGSSGDAYGTPSMAGAFDTAQYGSPEADLNQWFMDQNPDMFGVSP